MDTQSNVLDTLNFTYSGAAKAPSHAVAALLFSPERIGASGQERPSHGIAVRSLRWIEYAARMPHRGKIPVMIRSVDAYRIVGAAKGTHSPLIADTKSPKLFCGRNSGRCLFG